ncbi:MAG: AraC family transcriptional regulator [Sphingomonadales bacterium]|nr:AraC family transcriptional regulator [Sphingomonadales bacterium]MDE2569169.1 AraC family transcriptional regulator [Sphingomonadales bacterium]
MNRIPPAVDRAIASGSGETRDGQPISYNRPPPADLAPWVARFYVTKVEAPSDYLIDCGLFIDTSSVRLQLSGEWHSETQRGPMRFGRDAVFCGPHSRRMPLKVRGGFVSAGFSFRPGACHALRGAKLTELLDCVVPLEAIGESGDAMFALLRPGGSRESWVGAMENWVRELVERRGKREPDPVTVRFEAAAYSDPGRTVSAIAQEFGVEQRRLERIVKRDFGMSPKQVLRRARALDMASHLRGVADHDEAEELALRYYDQSHLIREFIALFGMSPSQFVNTPQPLMTTVLENRQARRLEMMERIAPGGIRPWE